MSKKMEGKMEKIIEQIARQHGVTPEEVRREMAAALGMAYANPSSEQIAKQQAQVPREGDVPTLEEFIQYAVDELRQPDPQDDDT